MHTLTSTEALAARLMAQHGLTGWRFGWDNARKRFGCCQYHTRTITLSRHLTPQRDAAAVEQTLLHEIAHALVGAGHGHSRVWLRKAREIGYTGGRCSSEKVQDDTSPYVGTCDRCGRSFPRYRVEARVLDRPVYRHAADGGTVTIRRRRALTAAA